MDAKLHEEYRRLMAEHFRATAHMSMTREGCPTYLALKALGPGIVPFLIEDLRKDDIDSGWWIDNNFCIHAAFHLLWGWADDPPVLREDEKGRVDLMRLRWLGWGAEHNL
jgi:hypothetical protein